MTPTQLAEQYLSEREASPHYRWFLRRVASQLEKAGVRRVEQMTPSSVNAYLSGLRDLSPTTRANRRRGCLVLWNYAAREDLATHHSGRILRVKQVAKAPVAWSMDELRRLIDHCRTLPGTLRTSGCPRSLFFTGFVLAGYELGIRRSDLHNLRADAVHGDRVYVVQNKTGIAIGKTVTPECAAVLAKLIALGDGKTVFRWALGQKWLNANFREVVKGAGLRGTIKYLRRSGATHCEIAQPGSSGRFLGHLTPGLAMRFYVDPTLATGSMPRPPALQGEGVAKT